MSRSSRHQALRGIEATLEVIEVDLAAAASNLVVSPEALLEQLAMFGACLQGIVAVLVESEEELMAEAGEELEPTVEEDEEAAREEVERKLAHVSTDVDRGEGVDLGAPSADVADEHGEEASPD